MNNKNFSIIDLCKKHPSWKNLFTKIIKTSEEKVDEKMLCESFNLYIKHKNLLKKEVTIELSKKMFKDDKDKFVENFFDHISKTIFEKQKNNFIKSLKTKGYKHLFNEDVEEKISNILDNKITIQAMKHQFFNKFLYYKNTKDLLKGLSEFQSKNINWNLEYFKKLIKELNANIIQEAQNKIIVEIKNYEACKVLGSSSWCIVNSIRMYESYTRDLRRQLIILDFNLPIEDNESMIGVTVDIKGGVVSSHLKNDWRTNPDLLREYSFPEIENLKEHLTEMECDKAFVSIIKMKMDNFIEEWIMKYDIFNPSIDKNYALRWAIKNQKIEVVKKIINNKKYYSSKENADLYFAIEYGDENISNVLFENADKGVFNIEYNMALARCATKGYEFLFKKMKQHPKADLNFCNHSALQGAIYYKRLNIIKEIKKDQDYINRLDLKLKEKINQYIN